jgi:hypothetical protein
MINVCFQVEILEMLYSLDHEKCEWCLESASKLSQVRPPINLDKIPAIKTPEGQMLFGAKRKFLEERGFARIPPSSAEAIVPDFLNVHEVPESHSCNNQPYVIINKEKPTLRFPDRLTAVVPHPRPGYNFFFLEHLRDDKTRNILFDLDAVRFVSDRHVIVVHKDSRLVKLLPNSALWESRQRTFEELHLDAPFIDRSVR